MKQSLRCYVSAHMPEHLRFPSHIHPWAWPSLPHNPERQLYTEHGISSLDAAKVQHNRILDLTLLHFHMKHLQRALCLHTSAKHKGNKGGKWREEAFLYFFLSIVSTCLLNHLLHSHLPCWVVVCAHVHTGACFWTRTMQFWQLRELAPWRKLNSGHLLRGAGASPKVRCWFCGLVLCSFSKNLLLSLRSLYKLLKNIS